MDPHTGVLPGLKVMVDRATGWKFSWQQSPLAAGPQDVKDGVEDGTKFGGARSRRRQNRRNKSPRRVRQIGVVESSAHRTVPLTRISALSRRTSTFQTPSYQSTRSERSPSQRQAGQDPLRASRRRSRSASRNCLAAQTPKEKYPPPWPVSESQPRRCTGLALVRSLPFQAN